MHPKFRQGKVPTWLVVLGGLLIAVGGPWGATTLWKTWHSKQSPETPASPLEGMPPASGLSDHVHPLSQSATASGRAAPVGFPSTGGSPGFFQTPSADPATLALTNPSAQTIIQFEDVFRFDLTIREILARWPRVSTSLADLQLQGYRVPLVTGAAETDLAGALTYYFNSYQQVQRIAFQGTTGDARELVQFLTSRYGFQRRVTNDPSLFVYEVPRLGGPQSILRLKLAPAIKNDWPHQRFDVSLVIEKPEDPPKSFWQRLGRNP